MQENTEAKARAAGIVFRQQYMERPINIACTGKSLWHTQAHVRFLQSQHLYQFLFLWYDLIYFYSLAESQNECRKVKNFCLILLAGVFDPYIPPEGDARLSSLSKEGLKQRTEQLRQSAASQLA